MGLRQRAGDESAAQREGLGGGRARGETHDFSESAGKTPVLAPHLGAQWEDQNDPGLQSRVDLGTLPALLGKIS